MTEGRKLNLLLVRHGQVEGISPPRFRGRKNLSLTELGQRQAAATAAYIASNWQLSAIISSPLARCVDTAEPLAAATGAPVTTTDKLLDLDYGEWAWKTHPEVREQWPDLYRLWFSMPQLVRIPGGDSLQDLLLRSSDALRSMIDEFDGETIAAIAHDSVNRALLVQLLDLPLSSFWSFKQDPCCINVIAVGGKKPIRTINSTAHLAALPQA